MDIDDREEVESTDDAPPHFSDIAQIDTRAADLATIAETYAGIQREIAKLEKAKKPISDLINELAVDIGLPRRVLSDDGKWEVQFKQGTTSKISAEMLLQHGVPMDVIGACTVESSWSKYTVVNRPAKKEKKGTANRKGGAR